MVNMILDAPWIEALERDGVDVQDVMICPICGEETTEYVLDKYRNVVGCNWCTEKMDACRYAQERTEENQ